VKRNVIACEGFHDRSFWSGWLQWLKCADCRSHAPEGLRKEYDPHTRLKVTAGLFGFWTPADDWVLVVHADGDRSKVNLVVSNHLQSLATGFDALDLVVSIDSDVEAGTKTDPVQAHHASLLAAVRAVDRDAALADGVITLADGKRRVHPVIWWTPDAPGPGLPSKQCLERLVSAAMVEAYPQRAGEVEAWLASRTDPPNTCPKEHAWSYMAGWFASHGCDHFWREIWRDEDEPIRTALLSRLEKIGAAQALRAILGGEATSA
jgi:hypothetical protein